MNAFLLRRLSLIRTRLSFFASTATRHGKNTAVFFLKLVGKNSLCCLRVKEGREA